MASARATRRLLKACAAAISSGSSGSRTMPQWKLPSPTWPTMGATSPVSSTSRRVSTRHSASREIGTQTSVDQARQPGPQRHAGVIDIVAGLPELVAFPPGSASSGRRCRRAPRRRPRPSPPAPPCRPGEPWNSKKQGRPDLETLKGPNRRMQASICVSSKQFDARNRNAGLHGPGSRYRPRLPGSGTGRPRRRCSPGCRKA